MIPEVRLAGEQSFALSHAILVYSDGSRAFATLHDPVSATPDPEGPPTLGPGRPVTTAFLRELGAQLGNSVSADVLPPEVLVRTSEVIAWWRPPSIETLFYDPAENDKDAKRLRKLSGKRVPIPALVFRATHRALWVRALLSPVRPTATTQLYAAPFYNVGRTGSVCVGSMRIPHGRGLDTLPQWERSFFESEFTHLLPGAKPTKHNGGFVDMWEELATSTAGAYKRTAAFPGGWLQRAGKQTLGAFVATKSGGDW